MPISYVVTAKPGSSRNHVQQHDEMHFTIWTTAIPEHGKANEAILKLLADHLNLPKSRLHLVAGRSGRTKMFSVA